MLFEHFQDCKNYCHAFLIFKSGITILRIISQKHNIPFLVTKSVQILNQAEFSDPRP